MFRACDLDMSDDDDVVVSHRGSEAQGADQKLTGRAASVMASRQDRTYQSQSRQGAYRRDAESTRKPPAPNKSRNVGNRSQWYPHVLQYIQKVFDGSLASHVACSHQRGFPCPTNLACGEKYPTISVLKQCAAKSFGSGVLDVEKNATGRVVAILGDIRFMHAANSVWFAMVRDSRVRDPRTGTLSVSYSLPDGSQVCLAAWHTLMGVKWGTAESIQRKALAGVDSWTDETSRQLASAQKSAQAALVAVATGWWMGRLRCYEVLSHQPSTAPPHPPTLSFRSLWISDTFCTRVTSTGSTNTLTCLSRTCMRAESAGSPSSEPPTHRRLHLPARPASAVAKGPGTRDGRLRSSSCQSWSCQPARRHSN